MSVDSQSQELLRLNQQLLDAIATSDWKTYAALCDEGLSAFEPEACGQLVVGLDFHRFYFTDDGAPLRHCTTMASPHVRLMGDAAVVSYVRLNQRAGPDGFRPVSAVEETRVWQRKAGAWKHVHFHRSKPAI